VLAICSRLRLLENSTEPEVGWAGDTDTLTQRPVDDLLRLTPHAIAHSGMLASGGVPIVGPTALFTISLQISLGAGYARTPSDAETI
jgi:hypothetical protein